MCRDSSASGSKEKTKITTTRREKNSMEFSASFDRHSRRMSFTSVATVTAQREFIETLHGGSPIPCDQQFDLPASTLTHQPHPQATAPGGSRQRWSCRIDA